MTHETSFPSTYDGLYQILCHLRGPEGCPWDREQTRESLKPQLLEECYELIEAIEEGDTAKLIEELGDVLLHFLFQVLVAEERGEFTQEQVFGALIAKLVRRHPHVFGDASAASAAEVLDNWQVLKRREREGTEKSVLDGVPRLMPALAYAQAIQERAARVGFDWDDFEGVLEKVAEEVQELRHVRSDGEREQEMGDVLASLVNVARWLNVDAESALRKANARFYRRFTTMERLSRERGVSLEDLSLDEKEVLWQEAKRMENASG